jgi:hypothetical protein
VLKKFIQDVLRISKVQVSIPPPVSYNTVRDYLIGLATSSDEKAELYYTLGEKSLDAFKIVKFPLE